MKRELYEELNPQLEADLRKIENPELIGELAGSDAETVFDNPGLHVDIRKTYSPVDVIEGCRILLRKYNGNAHVAYTEALDRRRGEEGSKLESKVDGMNRRRFLELGLVGIAGALVGGAIGFGGSEYMRRGVDRRVEENQKQLVRLEKIQDDKASISDVYDLTFDDSYFPVKESVFYSQNFEKDKFGFGIANFDDLNIPLPVRPPTSISLGNSSSQKLVPVTHYSFRQFDFNFGDNQNNDIFVLLRGNFESIKPCFYFWDESWKQITDFRELEDGFQLSLNSFDLQQQKFSLLVFPNERGHYMDVDSVELRVKKRE